MAIPGTKSPELTWTNITASIGVMCVMAAGAYAIIENQFAFVQESARQTNENLLKQIELSRHEIELIHSQYLSLREHIAYQQEQSNVNISFAGRINTLETVTRDLLARSAHSPVEAKEVDVFSAATDKRFDAVQQQINDINRQIAASILTPGGVLHLQQPSVLPPH
jgi:hypothetical protein